MKKIGVCDKCKKLIRENKIMFTEMVELVDVDSSRCDIGLEFSFNEGMFELVKIRLEVLE
jgi:hypothetical protein